VIGTEGTVCLNLIESEIRIYRGTVTKPEIIKVPSINSNQTYFDEMNDFLTAVDESRPPLIPLEQGIAVLQIALASNRAAETGIKQPCH
jgi:predicted dehydrogenase